MSSTRTLTGMLPSEVTAELGDTHEVIQGILRAERNGVATITNAVITHTGYQRGATMFNAATALYAVRY